MDAQSVLESGEISLSEGLLSGSNNSRRKILNVCFTGFCAIGLFLTLVAFSSGGSIRDPVLDSTSVFLADLDPAKLKKVIKEGGKRGVEIEGASDLGGTAYFCTVVQEPEGDVDYLMQSVIAMNQKCEPGAEERKGCSGHVGKMALSDNDDQLAIVAYVPEDKYEELSCEEWLQHVLNPYTHKVISKGQNFSTGIIPKDADKGIFPLKIRDDVVKKALDFLRAKKLFPEAPKDDDSSDMVFGDDYVPPDDI
eukprot:gnl/MRDRNA2_/MRDRNA2_137605_c0_seq1.p1 gnl/MRDRNA2_/MRDRNA2_137605_c0~~gnl/MRDRNA2_/MRDRNA2_137605_c0_seq1.p1  ORF type:complete len:251 (-),score=58.70 gnl/MRDRNA2_/MRDRNA2_137605_c0_seq1:194-946(-)